MSAGQAGIHTFLIADIRGYSRYTDEFGAEAAAGLTAQFVELVTDDVEAHGTPTAQHDLPPRDTDIER